MQNSAIALLRGGETAPGLTGTVRFYQRRDRGPCGSGDFRAASFPDRLLRVPYPRGDGLRAYRGIKIKRHCRFPKSLQSRFVLSFYRRAASLVLRFRQIK